MKEKFKLQDSQYSFPYHYIVSVEKNKINLTKNLSWGLEYLRNINFIIENYDSIIKNNNHYYLLDKPN